MKAKNLIPGLVILAAWAGFFHDLPGQTFILRDSFQEFYPEWKYLAQVYAQGYFPLWNPFQYLGLPFLAQTFPAAFYPLIGLFLILPFDSGFSGYIALHYLLAGFFMWRWLSRLDLHPAAALIGALAYMESGYLVSMQGTLNYLAPLPWLPLLMLAFDHLLARPRLRALLLAAAVFGVPILVGDPLSEIIWLALLLGWFLVRRPSLGAPAVKALPLVAGLSIFAGLLFLIQILPALELGPFTEKASGYQYDEITRWSFHPGRTLEWIFPGLWGFSWPENRFWARFLVFGFNTPWAMSTYLGLVPLLGFSLAVSRLKDRVTLGLFILFLLFLLLACGRYTPLYKMLLLLPGMDSFRYPEKLMAPATFLLCTLAGLGLNQLAQKSLPTRSRFLAWLPLGFSACITLAAAAGYLRREPLAVWLHDLVAAGGFNAMPAALLAHALGKSLGHTLAVAFTLFLVFTALRFRPALGRWLLLALVLIGWLDLHTAHRPLLAFAPQSLFQDQPQVAQILGRTEAGDPQSFRIHRDPLIPFPDDASSPRQSGSLARKRRWEHETILPNRGINFGLTDYLGYTPARPKWIQELKQVGNRRLWALAGVKYLLTGIENEEPLAVGELEGLTELSRLPELNLIIFKNPEALPRAFAVSGARRAKDPEQAIHDLLDTDFSRQVILAGSGEPSSGSDLIPARLLFHNDQRLEVTARLEKPGWMVLSDTYFPGWQAEVNGTPARILLADYLVRAVPLPTGFSRVEFLYRPWAFRLGLWASLVSLLGIIPGLAFRRSSKPKPA